MEIEYGELIRANHRWIKDIREFDKWARAKLIFNPLIGEITESHKRLIRDIESTIRDLQQHQREYFIQGESSEISDYSPSPKRGNMGNTQAGTSDSSGSDITG